MSSETAPSGFRQVLRDDALAGRRILVTGGGTGLGRAMAERFLGLGARVMICGRRSEVLERAAAEMGTLSTHPVETFPVDLRDAGRVEALFETAFADGEGPDTLINNAAANFVARSETLSHRALDAIIDTSLKGALYCTSAFGKRRLAAQAPGTVLSIITSYAWHGSPYVVPSAIAKAGLLTMTRSLAQEWGPRGIRFVALSPGAFPTKGAWERLVPRPELARRHETGNLTGRPGDPAELAELAAFLISDAAAYIHGECVTIDGGRWLKGVGTFGHLGALDEEDWTAMR
ncbi:SDR family oxidoreductase [Saliniramus fredricksonii]|uniref:NAD(P)-dependent dehydrogenase, short-chain alcohol dehydrogenase family n=1 Tax=Saliniramus fredricksonii TaxID=1653334 RepID=A0ABY0K9L3_9HYPH|nr:SDR family oxidoreductase [Saliniramus fredricksonii]SCC81175.1 NAD(P)-dependent dehydrogenase, short-chain alcohol dehydrogenase family [Saliniramus fredricksonii]